MSEKKAARTDILSGWKQIANHLGKGIRTVQRYERELGLPLHRLSRSNAGAVFATNVNSTFGLPMALLDKNFALQIGKTKLEQISCELTPKSL